MKYLNLDGLSNFLANLRNTFADKDHTHNDIYYTETEIDTKVDELQAGIDEAIDTANIQVDWNQNDETAVDYVRNRTHWTSGPVETVLVEEMSVEIVETDAGREDALPYMFVEGETYTIIWNGVSYECVARNDGDDDIYVGNQSLSNGWKFPETIESSEPFFIATYASDSWSIINASEIGTHTVSIISMISEVHKIDSKYLPDDIARVSDVDYALSNKADITDVDYALNNKADLSHTHTLSQITNIDSLQDTYYTESEIDTKISSLQTGIDEALDVANIQSDWNQNDETAVDYVKNRTHYQYEEVVNVFSKENIGMFYTSTGSPVTTYYHSYSFNDIDTSIIESLKSMTENYTGHIIFYDSKGNVTAELKGDVSVYNATSGYSYYYYVFGNKYLLNGITGPSFACDISSDVDTGEGGAFVITLAYYSGQLQVDHSNFKIVAKAALIKANKITLEYATDNMVQLDEKFIPETIARTVEVDTALATKADATHTHAIADVTNLQASLNSLQSSIDSIEDIPISKIQNLFV